MEKNINLAKILNGKPVNTKLWSPLFGDVYTSSICSEDTIIVVNHHAESSSFYNNGKYFNHAEAELLLFPSKEMRDWGKFAWKKGDLLINSCGFQCIFKEWASGDYTKFNGCYSNSRDGYEDVTNAETAKFDKLDNNIAYGYVREIERKLGGILNLETLEIENAHPKFKDWDFITIKLPRGRSLIGVFKAENDKKYYLHANLDSRGIITICEDSYCKKSTCIARLSTEEEKMYFLDALAKKGKTWDAEKKAIMDLKRKGQAEPFDRCIWKIRNCEGSIWQASFISYVDEYGAVPMGMSIAEDLVNLIILPYNDQTKLLVGTTDEWKGGEQ